LSLYGYTTRRDLTAMGKFLFMGVIGLILTSLVNMIWPSGTMSFIISAAGVLIFSGLIAYDTQKIKEQFAGVWGTDAQEKVAIFSALSLYINFRGAKCMAAPPGQSAQTTPSNHQASLWARARSIR
jgi:FtsH-binding integral membrane protein